MDCTLPIRLTILVAILLPLNNVAQPYTCDTLQISRDDAEFESQIYNLRPYLTMITDSVGTFTIDSVASGPFQARFHEDSLGLLSRIGSDMGMDVSGYWARVVIESQLDSSINWLINIDAQFVELYIPIDSNRFKKLISGDRLPMKDRYFEKSYGILPCLPLEISPGSTQTIYFKLSGIVYMGGQFHQHLFAREVYSTYARRSLASGIFFLGILIAVAIYHLLIFMFQRKPVYLFFSLFVLSSAVVTAIFSGHSTEFLFPGIEREMFYVPLAWACLYLFFYLFSRSYLRLRTYLPVWDKVWGAATVLRILASLVAAGVLISAGGMVNTNPGTYYSIARIGYYLTFFVLLISLLTAVLTLNKGYRPAGIYLIAMGLYVLILINNNLAAFVGISILPFDIPGNVDSIVLVLIFSLGTARQIRVLEQEKIAAQKVQVTQQAETERVKDLDRFKTQFFTNITHEFRTPLTIILGMVEQVKTQPTTWLNRGTEMIRQNGLKLLNLINQILDLSKLEAGSMPTNFVRGNVVQYLNYLVESLQSKAQQKNIKLNFQTDLHELAMDYDPDKLSKIVTNLVSNAIKFTHEQGTINVQAMTDGASHTILTLAISDDGPGIAESDLAHIFDRYYQVDTEQKNRDKGTGIGLALTKELVNLLKGSIHVKSTLGEGTTFDIQLPITRKAKLSDSEFESLEDMQPLEMASIDLAEQHAHTDKPIVLVVEDSRDVIEYISSVLQYDYIILTAFDGKQGLDSALKHIPDIIVSDVMMPVMDGYEMCRRVKEDIRTCHIPIVLLTAKADSESKIEGFRTGADAYLFKPFDTAELLVRINNLIELRNKLRDRYRDFRFLFEAHDASADKEAHCEDTFIRELQRKIEDSVGNPEFNVNALCKSMHMSRAQLYRKFKALTDISLADFIRKNRLYKARHLLQNTGLNVTQVSMDVGFKNLSTFSRSFAEEFGINPSAIVRT